MATAPPFRMYYHAPDRRAGFLVVRTFDWLYAHYAPRYSLERDVYALPRMDRAAPAHPIKYCGLDRDALTDYEGSDNLAEVRLAELRDAGRCCDGMVFSRADAEDALDWLGDERGTYELIWAGVAGAAEPVPPGFVAAGYEPTYFWSDHFSASCDCLLFPRWHGTDQEGTLFLAHFRRLNRHGLFESPEDADAFLRFYLAQPWTEHDEYAIAQVAISREPAAGTHR